MCQGHERNGKENVGNGKQTVHDPHHHHVDTADVAGHQSNGKADDCAQCGNGQTHDQGHTAPMDRAVQNTAAELVSAEPVIRAWRLQTVNGIELYWIADNPRREQRCDGQE